MNWTFENFESQLAHLNPQVKEKAIELANHILAEGKYSDQLRALKEGIKQAEEWFLNLEG